MRDEQEMRRELHAYIDNLDGAQAAALWLLLCRVADGPVRPQRRLRIAALGDAEDLPEWEECP